MNKDEILEKSRGANVDEGLLAAEAKGRKIGEIAFCLMFIPIVIFDTFTGQPIFGSLALFWAFFAGAAYPRYRFTGEKSYLVTTIVGGIAAVLFLVCHILNVLR